MVRICQIWSEITQIYVLGSPGNKSKYGPSAQMTMPARRASTSCAKRRAALLPIFFLSLISFVIPGNIEPWPECQPEQLVGSFFVRGGYFGLGGFCWLEGLVFSN